MMDALSAARKRWSTWDVDELSGKRLGCWCVTTGKVEPVKCHGQPIVKKWLAMHGMSHVPDPKICPACKTPMKLVMEGMLSKYLDYYICQACGFDRHVKAEPVHDKKVKEKPVVTDKPRDGQKTFF